MFTHIRTKIFKHTYVCIPTHTLKHLRFFAYYVQSHKIHGFLKIYTLRWNVLSQAAKPRQK